METVEDKPKIKFVKNLRLYANAIYLYWINEIHIDETFKDSPILDDIIKHEMKHYQIVQKILKTKSKFKRILLLLYNNIFDFIDCVKLDLLYMRTLSKKELIKNEDIWFLIFLFVLLIYLIWG